MKPLPRPLTAADWQAHNALPGREASPVPRHCLERVRWGAWRAAELAAVFYANDPVLARDRFIPKEEPK